MRKVFLDELPFRITKDGIKRIKWVESIGFRVKFIYDDISEEVEIINYLSASRRLTIKYEEKK